MPLHLPSISRAAMPDKRTCGPSAHQIGPSPSQTRIGVHANDWPAGTIAAAQNIRPVIGLCMAHSQRHRHPDRDADHTPAARGRPAHRPRPWLRHSYEIRLLFLGPAAPATAAVGMIEVRCPDGKGSRRSDDCYGSHPGSNRPNAEKPSYPASAAGYHIWHA